MATRLFMSKDFFPQVEQMWKEMNRCQELGSSHYLKNAF